MKMKNLWLTALGLILVAPIGAMACEGEDHSAMKSASGGKPQFVLSEAGRSKAVFQIAGMSCKSCERSVSAQLKKIVGVQDVVFLAKKAANGVRTAEVTFAPQAKVDTAQLLKAVEAAGYSATAID
jgi:copper chaperone CopZ